MSRGTFRLAIAAALFTFVMIAKTDAQQVFLPTGVQTANILSGIYPGDTEGDCCWLSDGATIQLAPPPDAAALLLDVFIPEFALTDEPQRLYVTIGTGPEQATAPLSSGAHVLSFALQQTTLPALLDVQIRPSYTFVPAQLGMNQDPRHLSVLVRAVQFSTQADAPVLPPDSPPQIVFLRLNKTTFSSGEDVTGVVTTSTNVASVEARIATFTIGVPRIAPGQFMLRYTVPKLPRFLRRTYDLVVVASNAAGDKVQQTVPITIH